MACRTLFLRLGSIFSTDGSVIHGPAVEPLPLRKLPKNWLR
jgi:hypothetical protein